MRAKDYFCNGDHVAEAQLRMLRRYGHDNVWCLHYVGKEVNIRAILDAAFEYGRLE